MAEMEDLESVKVICKGNYRMRPVNGNYCERQVMD